MLKDIFKDLKIVELSNILAGPLVGSFFAELGAEVIKIENPSTGGDITRQWKMKGEETPDDISAYYLSANYGKKLRYFDLKDERHFADLIDLIKEADILITNFKQGSLDKFKLSASHISAISPQLIYAQLTAYDDSDKPGFDIALQAETGFISMTGTDSNHLARMPVALIDVIAAHQLKEAILIALIKQTKQIEFCHIKLSLYGTALTSLVNQATNFTVNGIIPEAMGLKHPNIAPYGEVLHTKDDRQIVLAVGTDQQYIELLRILEIQNDMINTYNSNSERIEHRIEIENKLNLKSRELLSKNLIKLLTDSNIPAGLIKNMGEVWQDKNARRYLNTNENFLTPSNVAFSLFYEAH